MINPQVWNAYSYVANNPLNATDPLGEELVKLGQHTDDEINKRQKEIDQQKKQIDKDKSLTKDQKKEQKKALHAERKTLGIEKQGNRVVGAMLKALDKIGQRNGLTLSDLTLTTDTQKDFEKYATTDALKLLVSDQAFVIRDSPQFSGTIYIRTEPAEGFYQLSRRYPDFVYDGASSIRHEQVHLRGGGEGPAYAVQDDVLHRFKPYFRNSEIYRTLDEAIHEALKKYPK